MKNPFNYDDDWVSDPSLDFSVKLFPKIVGMPIILDKEMEC